MDVNGAVSLAYDDFFGKFFGTIHVRMHKTLFRNLLVQRKMMNGADIFKA